MFPFLHASKGLDPHYINVKEGGWRPWLQLAPRFVGPLPPLPARHWHTVSNSKLGSYSFVELIHNMVLECLCSIVGTKPSNQHKPGDLYECDKNGYCNCKGNVVGKTCDTCLPGYWNIASVKGCEKCTCSRGAIGCEVTTGRCTCKPGIGDRLCNRCLDGYYQLSSNGCKGNLLFYLYL